MGKYRKCAVVGCADKTSHRHRFPNPQKNMDIFQQWVLACGNATLGTLNSDVVYSSHRVCHVHFREEDHASNSYLQKGTLPRLLLPDSTTTGVSEQINKEVQQSALVEHDNPKNDKVGLYELDRPAASFSDQVNILLEHDYVAKNKTMLSSPLGEVGVTRSAQLTPKARKLYERSKVLRKSLNSVKRRGNLFKVRCQTNKEELLETFTAPLQPTVANFVRSQLRLCTKAPKGRRYTLDDKVLGLVLHKQSGKAYKTLSKIFSLPTRKTMMALLNKVPINAGLNAHIFENLKANVTRLKPRDRVCILMFDEMSLEPHVDINKATKEFDGFVDYGDGLNYKLADHAQVFMLKGITKSWKQPIAYTFCKGTTPTIDLVRILKAIISQCHEAGLTILATVSDQGATNQAAINYLMNQTVPSDEREYFKMKKIFRINNQQIVHIYDPPHLLKGIRNNLLTKNLVWPKNNEVCVAKWAHIKQVYEMDNTSGELRAMPKLTEGHVNPQKLKKMKVSCAAQVLSHTVASVMALMARKGITTENNLQLDASAMDTAKIIHFFDRLFDSVNGHTLYPGSGKTLKCAVSATSGHLEYWREARNNLSKMYFQTEGKSSKEKPPSLTNWGFTLAGLEELHIQLIKHKASFFRPRNINQDPLENFFGQMRQHGGRNSNPTVNTFKNHFKTLLLNNFVTRHSLTANCENENSTYIINSVKEFVSQGVVEINSESSEANMTRLTNMQIPTNHMSYIGTITLGYVSGFIAKKISFINSCAICKNNVICQNKSEWHDLISEKEYSHNIPNKLKYCTPWFIDAISQIYNITITMLPNICTMNKFLIYLFQYLRDHVNFNFKNQCEHFDLLKNKVIEHFTMLICNNWAVGINRLLAGKDDRKIINNDIFSQAQEYHAKRRKYK